MSTRSAENLCLCGSGQLYQTCCQPYHQGHLPPTPEAVMRSRYSAYALGNVRYIIDTTHADSPYAQKNKSQWIKSLKEYTDRTTFVGLLVQETSIEDDGKTGYVVFSAVLLQDGKNASFSEKSRFFLVNNRWLYVDGDVS